MKSLFAGSVAASALVVGFWFGLGHGASPEKPVSPGEPVNAAAPLIVHEWGTFTSFSGSDGKLVGFRPNNQDLPNFVYVQGGDETSKSGLLAAGGTVSMETPVIYFYSDREMRASVQVKFPSGWITEWYPLAATAPGTDPKVRHKAGQTIGWDVKLLAGAKVPLPRGQEDNHYYEARGTDAVPLEVETVSENRMDHYLHGASLVQREKFLFYRGVGTFQPPVTIQAQGNGKVQINNVSSSELAGLVLVTAREGKLGFQPLGTLAAGAKLTAALPVTTAPKADLAAEMQRELVKAGLFEKEAQAMVKTWEAGWFGESGTRLLYLVPRKRTDELLPLTITPSPSEIVRVLVGRQDFLTPEQEVMADKALQKSLALQAELQSIEKELSGLGRFSYEARNLAQQRLTNPKVKK